MLCVIICMYAFATSFKLRCANSVSSRTRNSHGRHNNNNRVHSYYSDLKTTAIIDYVSRSGRGLGTQRRYNAVLVLIH